MGSAVRYSASAASLRRRIRPVRRGEVLVPGGGVDIAQAVQPRRLCRQRASAAVLDGSGAGGVRAAAGERQQVHVRRGLEARRLVARDDDREAPGQIVEREDLPHKIRRGRGGHRRRHAAAVERVQQRGQLRLRARRIAPDARERQREVLPRQRRRIARRAAHLERAPVERLGGAATTVCTASAPTRPPERRRTISSHAAMWCGSLLTITPSKSKMSSRLMRRPRRGRSAAKSRAGRSSARPPARGG